MVSWPAGDHSLLAPPSACWWGTFSSAPSALGLHVGLYMPPRDTPGCGQGDRQPLVLWMVVGSGVTPCAFLHKEAWRHRHTWARHPHAGVTRHVGKDSKPLLSACWIWDLGNAVLQVYSQQAGNTPHYSSMHNQHCPGFVRAAMLSHMTEGNFVHP